MNTNNKKLIKNLINSGLETLNGITDPYQKVMAIAELSKAIAIDNLSSSGSPYVSNMAEKGLEISKPKTEVKEEPKEVVKEESKVEVKEEPKEEVKEEVKEEISEEVVAETNTPSFEDNKEPIEKEEVETQKWTEELALKHKVELLEMKKLSQKIGLEEFNKIVMEFSQGKLDKGIVDITPANIKAFFIYIKKKGLIE